MEWFFFCFGLNIINRFWNEWSTIIHQLLCFLLQIRSLVGLIFTFQLFAANINFNTISSFKHFQGLWGTIQHIFAFNCRNIIIHTFDCKNIIISSVKISPDHCIVEKKMSTVHNLNLNQITETNISPIHKHELTMYRNSEFPIQ